jgi:MarR family 2-MHQ and catechol resistance regulon transcriptional repressor
MNRKSYGEINDINLKTLIAISRSYQTILKRLNKVFKEGGLTPSQFGVLEALYHKGDLRIGEIIEKILSTGGNMTVVIDNLEKSGMVKRYQDPNDRRASIISITEKGRRKIEEIFPIHLEELNNALINLSLEEKKILINLLKKLNNKL